MKMKILMLGLIMFLTLTFSNVPATMQQIIAKHKQRPTFKYEYNNGVITFGILGYWENNEGVVYTFSQDELIDEKCFVDFKEFSQTLMPSNKKLKKYIIIPLTANNTKNGNSTKN